MQLRSARSRSVSRRLASSGASAARARRSHSSASRLKARASSLRLKRRRRASAARLTERARPWLLSSLRSMLGALGIPERETASRPANEEGEAQVLANVSGEAFLFVLRDGDFTAAHARRALEGEAEAHASRLVVVATGKIQDEARARLREHARRRARAGSDTEVVFIEGLDSASTELRRTVERVSQEALARELYELDSSAGFNVGYALAARFRLAQRKGALRDLAASAAGALAGSLREI